MNSVGQFKGFNSKPAQTDKKPAKKVADWKKGEELVGFFMETKTYPGTEFGPVTYHVLVKAEIKGDKIYTDDEVISLRSGAGLANQLTNVTKGQLIKLTYHGKEKNQKTGRSFHKFTCDKADNIYQPTIELDIGLGKDDESLEIDWED